MSQHKETQIWSQNVDFNKHINQSKILEALNNHAQYDSINLDELFSYGIHGKFLK